MLIFLLGCSTLLGEHTPWCSVKITPDYMRFGHVTNVVCMCSSLWYGSYSTSLVTVGGGHSLKIYDGDAWPHWLPFVKSLSPIGPLFRLTLTRWPLFKWFTTNFWQSLTQWPSFWQHLVKMFIVFEFFVKKVGPH